MRSGLIGDRPSTPWIIVANGRNSTNVPVAGPGGHGVAIVPPTILNFQMNHPNHLIFLDEMMICFEWKEI